MLTQPLWENTNGARRKDSMIIYLTVGTGIGGGGLINGKLMHGMDHPEMGHIRIPHDFKADPYAGGCPFHGDCLEGMASGKAMEKRWGKLPLELPPDHPAWELEATYLALECKFGLHAFSETYYPGRRRDERAGAYWEHP